VTRRPFCRIVRIVNDVGPWGEGVQRAFVDMDAIELADVDTEPRLVQDRRTGEQFDAGELARRSVA
jgi:hypothetical protein